MDNNYGIGTSLSIPRGVPGLPALILEMEPLYVAERRLHEIRVVSPGTYKELEGFYNEVCNTTSKFIAWVEYERLQAVKHQGLERARVILEEAPLQFKKLQDSGIKFNEDFREAVVMRDQKYQEALDRLNSIIAVKTLLEGKFWTFQRAYNSCAEMKMNKAQIAASPNLTGVLNTDDGNFIGERRRSNG